MVYSEYNTIHRINALHKKKYTSYSYHSYVAILRFLICVFVCPCFCIGLNPHSLTLTLLLDFALDKKVKIKIELRNGIGNILSKMNQSKAQAKLY